MLKAITLALPLPQAKYYCNVTGDSRLPKQSPFQITVRVPVGVKATVVFANITGPIPGTSCTAIEPGKFLAERDLLAIKLQPRSIQP